MFKNICISPSGSAFPTDIGLIAENLLYYQNVNLFAVPDTISLLLNNCGVETLIELLSNRNLRIYFRGNYLALATYKDNNGNSVLNPTIISSPNLTTEEMIFRDVFRSTGRRGYSKRIIQKILPYVYSINYQNEISDLAKLDIDNETYFKQSIIATIQHYNPSISIKAEDIEYELIKTEKGYLFNSNLNFEEINRAIPNNPSNNIINPNSFLLNILEIRGTMHIVSELGSEIATSALNTELMKIKFHDIYQRTAKGASELFQFNDFVLNNGHAIREVINSGDKNFEDFFKILDKADKFRNWLDKIDEDKSIIKEYYENVTSETWIDKLPSKGIRWSFFTGLGFAFDVLFAEGIGTALGLGLSLGDAFLLDKIVKGWRPNVFVNNELKRFVKLKE